MIGLKDVVVFQGLAESLCLSEEVKTDNISIVPLPFDITWIY